MSYIPNHKMAKYLDFSRPTYNEPMLDLPGEKNRIPSTYTADDEESLNDIDISELPKDKQTENINVYLRLRPYEQSGCPYKFNENTVILPQVSQLYQSGNTNTEKHYTFSSVLNEKVNQVEIYNEIVRPILSNPFDIRGTTFASYGVSSSGKTHTILGDTSAGLVPRAITQIFTEYKTVVAPFPCVKIIKDQISLLDDTNVELEIELLNDFLLETSTLNKGKQLKTWSPEEINDEHLFKVRDDIYSILNRLYVWISFVEIYNEEITDLLNNRKNSRQKLKIYSNSGNSYIHGAKWLFAANVETAFSILRHGLNKIKYAATGINDQSSRSHTILTINMIAEFGTDYQYSSFKFCDLAGAERLKKTGNVGDRLKEAGGINKSLLVLGRCLEAVQQNQNKVKKHPDHVIPVRDSKLTFLLQSSLLGHEKFVMIVNLYPTPEFLEENLNVLKFGSIASQIVVRKSEVRKFKRQSSRYSYIYPPALNNSLRNESISAAIHELSSCEDPNESELDESYKWSSMSNEQLRNHLRTYKEYIDKLKEMFKKSEKEDAENRKMILETKRQNEDRMKKRNEEEIKILKEYHEKKIEVLKIKYERLLNEAYDEIDCLEKKLKRLKREHNIKDPEEEVLEEEEEEEEEEEDIIEVDE